MTLDPETHTPRPVDDLLAECGHPSTDLTVFQIAQALTLSISPLHADRFHSLTRSPSDHPHCPQLGIDFNSLPMCP